MTRHHHIFGIRHHGPGSSKALLRALQELQPDAILVEGPPDGNHMLHWLNHEHTEPPVALLIYRPDMPKRAGYYPYTIFSPELQALLFGLRNQVPVRFADLPKKNILAGEHGPAMPPAEPLKLLAKATGRRSYESWWNVAIEQRRDSKDIFKAIFDLMCELRAGGGDQAQSESNPQAALIAQQREAAMRQAIREDINAGRQRIAFICGAWHAPALADLNNEAEDRQLLSDLSEVPVEAAWVPWTYSRLSMASGYGAGIRSPGWYHHLWNQELGQAGTNEIALSWLARVAGLLRQEDLDASSANIIEAVRLAEALAAMRDLPYPGLPELNEATQAVLCGGAAEPLDLIRRKLIVGERMGMVPPDSPMVPLQHDIYRLQKELSMPPDPEPQPLSIDLREEQGLARSHLLHRLHILGIPWGTIKRLRGGQNTTFEYWTLQWQPQFATAVVEAAMWGNTVEEASSGFAMNTAEKATSLAALTDLLDQVIMAGLHDAAGKILNRLRDETAVSSDIPRLMAALPPLAQVLRYGSVRRTDQELLQDLVDTLLTRICIGLPSTCAAIDDTAAAEMVQHIVSTTRVVHTLRGHKFSQRWFETLHQMADQRGLHGLLAGRICRILLDESIIGHEEAAGRLNQALGRGAFAALSLEQVIQAITWLDGFLQGSELLIVHDRRLWSLLDGWISGLPQKRFQEILPLLRRAFSHFSESAKNQLHERLLFGPQTLAVEPAATAEFDEEQAKKVLPVLQEILGM